jgi:hypothetical protein
MSRWSLPSETCGPTGAACNGHGHALAGLRPGMSTVGGLERGTYLLSGTFFREGVGLMSAESRLEERVRRLEAAVIYLQEIVLHADTAFKGKEDRAAIDSLAELTAAISAEHGSES